MNTNSNTYTITYASVMVIIVAFVLATVASALKPLQDTNVQEDKKKQILSALNVDFEDQVIADVYAKYVTSEEVLNSAGVEVSPTGGFSILVKKENSKDLSSRKLPLYVCNVDGAIKYVVPMRGMGLWGAIWGYIALDSDKDTVYGVYFSHESETPGLGAEITKKAFQEQFIGKKIKRDGKFVSISVVKSGKTDDSADYVDGISGGTITSKGVDAMLKSSIGQYDEFLNK